MIKRWEKWKRFLDEGDWHVHTSFTDGKNTIIEMCKQAKKNGLKLIAFTEHVRKNLTYDFSEFCNEIETARKKFPKLHILIGCEAKVINERGELDISKQEVERCDLLLASFHGFPSKEKPVLWKALKNMIKNPNVDIWSHPSTFFERCCLTEKEIKEIVNLCIKHKVLIENNINHQYKMPRFIEFVKKIGAKTVTSSDAHSVKELRKI